MAAQSAALHSDVRTRSRRPWLRSWVHHSSALSSGFKTLHLRLWVDLLQCFDLSPRFESHFFSMFAPIQLTLALSPGFDSRFFQHLAPFN